MRDNEGGAAEAAEVGAEGEGDGDGDDDEMVMMTQLRLDDVSAFPEA